jgi:TP901 family phage tail tape measure protein
MVDIGGGQPLIDARVRLRADGSGLAADAVRESRAAARTAGQAASRDLSRALVEGITKGVQGGRHVAEKTGTDAGKNYGAGFLGQVRARLGIVKDLVPQAPAAARAAAEAGVAAGTRFAREFSQEVRAGVGKALSKDLTDAQASALDDLGTQAAVAGAAIGLGVGAAVKSFADFDAAISRAAAGTDTAKESMGALQDAALRAGAATQFSAVGAADAITELGKAGVSTSDILSGGLDGALALAAAGQLDVADAAEISATALNQFQLEGKDMARVADLLAAGAGKAQGSVGDLANALKYVGPIANSMGVSIEETTGALALLASRGILSEQAGTSLRGFFASLVAGSQESTKIMEALGIQVYDAQGQFAGLASIAEQFRVAFAGMAQESQKNALFAIFGRETATSAQILFDAGAEGVRRWTDEVTDAGFASRNAAVLMDNLSGDVERLGGSFQTVLVQAGSGANAGLRTLTQTAEDAVNAFGALPDGVQQFAVIAGAASAGSLLLAGGVAKGAVAAKNLRDNLAEMGAVGARASAGLTKVGTFLTGPWGAAIGVGVALLGAYAVKQAEARAEVEELTVSLDQQTGALTKTSQALLFKDLKDSGAVDAAKTLGINLRDVQLAAEGNVEALARVNGQLEVFRRPVAGMNPYISQVSNLEDALNGTNGKIRDARDALRDKQIALAETTGAQTAENKAVGAAASVTDQMTDATTAASVAQAALGTELKTVNDEMKTFGKEALKARGAARDYESAIDDVSAAVKENGRTLNISTEAGRSNSQTLDALAAAAQDNADAVLAADGSQEKYEQTLRRGRAELIKAYLQFDKNRKRAEEYANAVLGIPETAYTRTGLQGGKKVLDDLKLIQDRVKALTSRRFNVRFGMSGAAGYSQGGWVPGAPSETDNQVHALASGEFVVRAKQAQKYASLLEAINSGGTVPQQMSATAAPSGGSGGSASVDPAAIASAVATGVRQALAMAGPGRVVLDGRVVGQLLQSGGRIAGTEGIW